MSAAAKGTREDLQGLVDTIKTASHQRFPEHQEKLAQLDAHLATVSMVLDDLHDTVPYLLNRNAQEG